MKNKILTSLILAVCTIGLLSFTSCKQATVTEVVEVAPDMDSIKTEIQNMEDAYAAALNAGDASAVAAYYSDDAQSLGSNEPTSVGKEAIIATIQKDIDESKEKRMTSFEVTDLFADGDLLVETGKSITKDSTGTVVRTGKYMSLFKKIDGKYVCIRDISNSDSKEE